MIPIEFLLREVHHEATSNTNGMAGRQLKPCVRQGEWNSAPACD